MISDHLDKKNPHHAYLIEGRREEVTPNIILFAESLGVKTAGNADLSVMHIDSFKVEDARALKILASERGYESKRIFIVSTNSFLLEAQNTLLKIFEEPIENTIFFLIVPDVNALLPTLISRFYLIKAKGESAEGLKDAEKFITLPLVRRIDFLKELLAEPEEDDEAEIASQDSARSKALQFLNQVEYVLHRETRSKLPFDPTPFEQMFKARKFLRMPGSSAKMLLESVALNIPNL